MNLAKEDYQWLLLGGLLSVLLLLLSATFGAYPLSYADLWALLSGQTQEGASYFLFWQIRLPRLLMAYAVGAALGLSGAGVQGLFQNPLAEPSLIGVQGGSMLAAAIYLVLIGPLLGSYSLWGLPIFAFLGAILACLAVYRMSTLNGRTYTASMLLAGVAITALCGAFTGLLTYFSDEAQLRDFTFWSLGSLAGSSWSNLLILLICLAPAILILLPMGPALNALLLGETEAQYMGWNSQTIKWKVLFAASLAVGASVALSGSIGFIGLLAPHLIRLWRGSNQRFLLPASAIVGGGLLLLADTFARCLLAPQELPLGVLTTLLGAPLFFYLVLQARGRHQLV